MDKNYAFLGTGWSFPPSFANRGGYVETVSGTADVFESIKIISSTEPGERVMRPDFGCGLSGFAFAEMTAGAIGDIRDTISRAIGHHEKRVELESIDVSPTEEEGVLKISVSYIISSDNSRYNMVFPYYLNEASRLDW